MLEGVEMKSGCPRWVNIESSRNRWSSSGEDRAQLLLKISINRGFEGIRGVGGGVSNVRFGSKADSFLGQNPNFNFLIGLLEHSANK